MPTKGRLAPLLPAYIEMVKNSMFKTAIKAIEVPSTTNLSELVLTN